MKALVPVANGSEDIETVTLIDVLRRAQIEVTVASVERDLMITCARGCRLKADATFAEARGGSYELIALPGGTAGAATLGRHAPLIEKLREQRAARRWYSAICAAPALVLGDNDLLHNKRATCYPSLKDHLPRWVDEAVVVDGHCVTSQGPATAMAFSLKLVELLCGAEKSRQVATAMLVPATAD